MAWVLFETTPRGILKKDLLRCGCIGYAVGIPDIWAAHPGQSTGWIFTVIRLSWHQPIIGPCDIDYSQLGTVNQSTHVGIILDDVQGIASGQDDQGNRQSQHRYREYMFHRVSFPISGKIPENYWGIVSAY